MQKSINRQTRCRYCDEECDQREFGDENDRWFLDGRWLLLSHSPCQVKTANKREQKLHIFGGRAHYIAQAPPSRQLTRNALAGDDYSGIQRVLGAISRDGPTAHTHFGARIDCPAESWHFEMTDLRNRFASLVRPGDWVGVLTLVGFESQPRRKARGAHPVA